MTKLNKVFVCGAGGQTGLQVVHYLNKHRDKFEVHAGIYHAKRQQHQERLQPYQVQVHETDAKDRQGLVKAMQGMDAIFVVPAATELVEEKVEQGRNYVEAAKEAKVPFVILLSFAGTTQHIEHGKTTVWHDQFRQMEKCLQDSGIASWCILRAAFYMDNLLLYRDQMIEGKLPLPLGPHGKFAPLDVMDVGIAVKSLLLDHTKHHGRVYEITGPQAMTGEQMAQALAEAWGRELRWEDIDPAEAERLLIVQGVPAGEIRGLLQFYQAVKDGAFQKTSQDYETICGDVPHDLKDWAKRHPLQ